MVGSPYPKPYQHITNVMERFFRYDERSRSMLFLGKTLEVRVPKRLEAYGLMSIENTVTTVGMMDLIIDDAYQATLHMLAKFETVPREVGTITVNGLQYFVLHYEAGDRFIEHTTVVKDKNIVYATYVETITRGNLPYWISYDDLPKLFDKANELCDADLTVDRAIFEVIYAHLARDPKDRTRQYRYSSSYQGPFDWIALRSVGDATTSTLSRLQGSYFSEGLNASLLREVEEHHPFEDVVRGVEQMVDPSETDAPAPTITHELAIIVDGRRRRTRVEMYALGPNGTVLAYLPPDGGWPELPAGAQDEGETLEAAGIRETAEEAGWVVATPQVLPVPGVWLFRGERPQWMVDGHWDEELSVGVVAKAQVFRPTTLYGSQGDHHAFALLPLSVVAERTRQALAAGLSPRQAALARFRLTALDFIKRNGYL